MGKKGQSKKHNKPPDKRRLWSFVVVAAAISGYLFYQSASESDPVPTEPSAARDAPAVESAKLALSAGDTLPGVSLLSLSGERLELRAPAGSRPIMLYVFSPSCSVCHEMLPVWKELYEEATSRSVEVIGISALGPMQTANYVRQFPIPWSVYSLANQAAMEALRLKRVPVTILVGGGGEIAMAVQGRLGSEQKALILQHLHDVADSPA